MTSADSWHNSYGWVPDAGREYLARYDVNSFEGSGNAEFTTETKVRSPGGRDESHCQTEDSGEAEEGDHGEPPSLPLDAPVDK